MIRLLLRNYHDVELMEMYTALSSARALVNSKLVVKDFDEALTYLSGYIDALEDGKSKKGGVR